MSSEPTITPAPNLDQPAIEVDAVGKCYHIYSTPRDRLKQLASRVTRKNYYREFWALKNVSFNVKRGQTVGIVGPNGSGKSTLLQLIAGILTPTQGKLSINGRIAALLELGAGFNPEFTGRENVYMNAAILGFSKSEVDDRYEKITQFADIGEFIDRPVKTYSSGMFVRLAFSVAVNVEPEILIVDEALAVGDIRFQARCFRKFEEFQNAGRTILFVSHSTEHIVRHCSHAILINKGELLAQGEPREISNRYMDLVFGAKGPAETIVKSKSSTTTNNESPAEPPVDDGKDPILAAFLNGPGEPLFEKRAGYNKLEYRWGDHSVEIVDYLLKTPVAFNINRAHSADLIELFVKVVFHKNVPRPIFGLFIKSTDGVTIFGVNSKEWNGQRDFRPCKTGDVVNVRFQFQAYLNTGNYMLSLGVASEDDTEVLPLDRRYDSIVLQIKGPGHTHGIVTLPTEIEVIPTK